MKTAKYILSILLIGAIFAAGCVGTKDEPKTPSVPQQPADVQPVAPDTGNDAAISSGSDSIITDVGDIESTSSELDSGITDADLDVVL